MMNTLFPLIPAPESLYRPDGRPWTPSPVGLRDIPRPDRTAAVEVHTALVQASGRMAPIFAAATDARRTRLVLALLSDAEVTASVAELAERCGRSTSHVRHGLAVLERHGYLERTGRGPRRTLRLRLPAGEGGTR